MIQNGVQLTGGYRRKGVKTSSLCSKCGLHLSPREVEYSVRWYRKALCKKCQLEHGNQTTTPYGKNG